MRIFSGRTWATVHFKGSYEVAIAEQFRGIQSALLIDCSKVTGAAEPLTYAERGGFKISTSGLYILQM